MRTKFLANWRTNVSRGKCSHDHLMSGSRAEGFRFRTSDADYMIVYNNVLVITDNDIIQPCIQPIINTIVKMETDQSRPGFCLLRFISQHRFPSLDVTQLCVRFQNGLYLTNTAWKDKLKHYIQDSDTHGPCETGIHGSLETDVAHCVKCKWPKSAYPCLQKLLRRRWPSLQCLSEIVKNGCHIVPIGDKTSCREFLEWRISFSEAEKTLIHQMNHCQFLTYGLLKLFLKGAINTCMRPDVDGLLCSYFLKTTVMWEIVYSGPMWREHDLLKWFWICFRRLLSWVSNGYCPNFFIPENNMFLGKIYGRSQQNLLHHLTYLYRAGYKCLLGCASIGSDFRDALCPVGNFVLPFDECYKRILRDCNLVTEIKCGHISSDIHSIFRCILYLERILRQDETSSTGTTIINSFLQYHVQQLSYVSALQLPFPVSIASTSNRLKYNAVVKYVNAIKGAKRDLLSHNILSAVLSYKLGMFHHAIRKANNIKERIQRTHVLYPWRLDTSEYQELGGDYIPADIMMKTFLVRDVSFTDMKCLPELYLEHSGARLAIPYSPIVLLNFLLFLSYHHLYMYREANSVLHELRLLMNNDDGFHISENIEPFHGRCWVFVKK
ncbi:hypothetical protein FSP39_024941 [Pinctada imbricata]|uniref:Uncharacterized protein n=1 Tax=Pinctada imbricata TaxID=66713 RepID=A0AA88YBU3_PINIB|nr:hypothetical protein FSP39_024941 [Pinctada imbricata]